MSLRGTLSEVEGDEAIQIRFLTEPVLSQCEVFGMTLCVRLLHVVYTEFIEVFAMTIHYCGNHVASYREFSS